ncbi:MAG: protein translocase subunit SecD [Sphingobacteriia bacterium]|nr:protein translocase subunit SecD [Sphingobacteriia bacterium]
MFNNRKFQSVFLLIIYVLATYFAVPSFFGNKLPGFPEQKINLGLDLRGGSQLLLQINFDQYLREQYDIVQSQLRKELRNEKIGYVNLKSTLKHISIDLRNNNDYSQFKKIVRKISSDLSIDKQDDNLILTYNDDAIIKMRKALIEQSIEIVRRRVDETGVTEPSIQPRGADLIDLQVPGLSSPEHLKKLLGKTAKLTLQLVNDEASTASRVAPNDSIIVEGDDEQREYIVKKEILLSGNDLIDARAIFDHGMPVVSFKFNTFGGKKFAEVTKENVGKRFAILLDNKVISAPYIREPILSGAGIISGNFTVESANELSLLLRAGALPAELLILEERSIGPSLGADSIESGKKAGIIALILVCIFMLLTYGALGIFANISLIMNMLLIMASLSLFGATLTLPGIAAIVLTIGMAVDANILIFERVREEIKNNFSLNYAIVNGFKNAFSAILDSNITTVIVALLLYVFGSGPVKGFAVSLTIGILSSMVSNILLTKNLLLTWVDITKKKSIRV